MLADPSFWVGVSFLLFIALLVYLKVPALVIGTLDDRAEKIRNELDEAKRLRSEAQALLTEYERKRIDAEKEAAEIIERARKDAESFAEETRRKMTEQLERRTRLAETKIAQAEETALNEVRNRATEVAIAAASSVLAEEARGAKGASLVDASIDAVKKQLN